MVKVTYVCVIEKTLRDTYVFSSHTEIYWKRSELNELRKCYQTRFGNHRIKFNYTENLEK